MNSSNWMSKADLLQLTGWDRATVYRKQAAGELRTRLAEAGRNGKRRREYDASTLPPELQARHLQQQLTKTPQPAPSSAGRAIRSLAALDGDAKAQAERRLAVIAPLVEFLHSGQKPLSQNGISGLSAIVQHIAFANKVSERTVWSWWNIYKSNGAGALANSPRKDRDHSRFFARRKEAAAFASNKFLNERLSIAMTHEAILREWPRLRLHYADSAPAYETTRLFLSGLPPIITAIAHNGEKAYKEDFAPFLVRDRSKLQANQFWVSDHMQHDVFVRNFDPATGQPVFGELQLNEAFRPWLTAIVDMKSRRVLGSAWSVNPSSNTISSALRIALERYGRPHRAFYVDNGKDYSKVSDDALGVLSRLGVRTQHCIPRHPQAKQIESFFHTLHQRFDVMWRPAYAGTSPKHRPEECDCLLHEHKRLRD